MKLINLLPRGFEEAVRMSGEVVGNLNARSLIPDLYYFD